MMVIPLRAGLEDATAQHLATKVIDEPQQLCAALAGGSGVWTVQRWIPARIADDPQFFARKLVRDVLESGGAALIRRFTVTSIDLELWSSPRC
jgi:hypothetical protein